jgi:hypothetical protein
VAEHHDGMLAQYRARLRRDGYVVTRDPFHKYKPDIYALKGATELLVEVEICSTFDSDHTMNQLGLLYDYIAQAKKARGVLVVPRSCKMIAAFMLYARFGAPKRLTIVGL